MMIYEKKKRRDKKILCDLSVFYLTVWFAIEIANKVSLMFIDCQKVKKKNLYYFIIIQKLRKGEVYWPRNSFIVVITCTI